MRIRCDSDMPYALMSLRAADDFRGANLQTAKRLAKASRFA
jgi:hypothetical protein